jgi:SsrA-binding protein
VVRISVELANNTVLARNPTANHCAWYHWQIMATRTGANAPPKQQNERDDGEKLITSNRQARHEYFILETLEAGLALTGTEIKSIRAGKVNLREAYARIENGEIWLHGMHIAPYEQAGGYFQHDPLRPRKLLLHRREIGRLRAELGQKGLTLVPLRLYLKRGRAKVEVGLAKGKKLYDKRATMAERDARRDVERALRTRD